jgi:hypothetical protein
VREVHEGGLGVRICCIVVVVVVVVGGVDVVVFAAAAANNNLPVTDIFTTQFSNLQHTLCY